MNDSSSVTNFLETYWSKNRQMTIRWLFHLRSKNGGLCDRDLFRTGIMWLAFNHANELRYVIRHIPIHGCWSDLLCLISTSLIMDVVYLFSRAIMSDLELLNRSTEHNRITEKYCITTAAKWCPSEGSSLDRKYKFCSKLCSVMMITKRDLRVKYLTPLRKALNITETLMCNNKWSEINYNNVGILAMKKYNKAFQRNDGGRFIYHVKNINDVPPSIRPKIVDMCWSIVRSWDPFEGVIKNRSMKSTVFNFAKLSGTNVVVNCSGSCIGLPISVSMALIITMGLEKWIPFSETLNSIDTKKCIIQLATDMLSKRNSISISLEKIIERTNDSECTRVIIISDIDFRMSIYDMHNIDTIPETVHILHWKISDEKFSILDISERFTAVTGYDHTLFHLIINSCESITFNRYMEYSASLFRYIDITCP